MDHYWLGGIYLSMKNYSESLTHFTKSLMLSEKSAIKNWPLIGNLYNDLGVIYDKTGNHVKALDMFERSLESFEKKFEKDSL